MTSLITNAKTLATQWRSQPWQQRVLDGLTVILAIYSVAMTALWVSDGGLHFYHGGQ